MAKGQARRSLRDARPPHRLLHSALKHGFVQVMPAALARLPVDVDARGWKHPLPRPLAAGVRVLPGQRPRELDPAGTVPEIGLVLPPDHLDMPDEIGSHDGGQHRHAVAVALAVKHDVPANPGYVRLLRASAAMASAQSVANAVEQTRPRSALWGGLSDGQRPGLAPLHGVANKSGRLTKPRRRRPLSFSNGL